MNKVILIGFIGQDPQPREFPEKNTIMSKFSIAVSDQRNYNQTYFFNCVAWNQTAEYINHNLKKGDFILIDGRITNRQYTNSSGAKASAVEVVVDSVKNFGTRKPKTDEPQKVMIDDYVNKKTEVESKVHETNVDNKEVKNDSISDDSVN